MTSKDSEDTAYIVASDIKTDTVIAAMQSIIFQRINYIFVGKTDNYFYFINNSHMY